MSGNPGSFRVPPHSVEAEQAVIGGLLIDVDAWKRIEGRIRASDFYRPDHRLIFEAITTLADRGERADIVTVSEQLRGVGQLKDAGGLAYLGQLAADTPSVANIARHAEIVTDNAHSRHLLELATKTQDAVLADDGASTLERLSTHVEAANALMDRYAAARGSTRSLKDVLQANIAGIEERHDNRDILAGLSTGLRDLDDITHGMLPGQLIVVGARPGMGKTAAGLGMATHAAIHDHPVLFLSMEMDAEQIGLRILASMGSIEMGRLLSGRLQEEDWPRLTSAVSVLNDKPLHIDDRTSLTVAEIRARARSIKGLRLIVVDYLGLMAGDGETQTIKVGNNALGCKNIAKELRVPVVLLAQLNRGLENRPNKRPMLADLRDSGEIEQHADAVLFLYRDDYYHDDSPDKGSAELIVAKQRNGPQGMVRLTWNGPYTRFADYHPDVYGVGL